MKLLDGWDRAAAPDALSQRSESAARGTVINCCRCQRVASISTAKKTTVQARLQPIELVSVQI
jgi:hypothetical protein